MCGARPPLTSYSWKEILEKTYTLKNAPPQARVLEMIWSITLPTKQ